MTIPEIIKEIEKRIQEGKMRPEDINKEYVFEQFQTQICDRMIIAIRQVILTEI